MDTTCVISDETVAKLYPQSKPTYTFPPGEASKTYSTKIAIEEQLIKDGFGPDATIIGLGGGVTLDLAGFIASTFCRGVRYIAMPTTLLAMVDAAIGGKNGINLGMRKNAIGTFYEPELIINPKYLLTLPDQEYLSGIAEMIKHALLYDPDLLDVLRSPLLFKRDITYLQKIINRNIKIKRAIISTNRDLLNFGHTVGHALEMLQNIPHGLAVAKGMSLETRAFGGPDIDPILKHFGFDLDIDIDIDLLWETMQLDKKKKGDALYATALSAIGNASQQEITLAHLANYA